MIKLMLLYAATALAGVSLTLVCKTQLAASPARARARNR